MRQYVKLKWHIDYNSEELIQLRRIGFISFKSLLMNGLYVFMRTVGNILEVDFKVGMVHAYK